MIEAAREVLNPLIKDIYIFSDASPAPFLPTTDRSSVGPKKKIGIGFGLSLTAESSTSVIYSADVISPPSGGRPPEDIGQQCAYQLLEAVSLGGCVSPLGAPTMLTLMAMGSEDVGRLQMGKGVFGTEDIIELGRDLRLFGGSGWGIRDGSGDDGNVIVSIVGRGVGNVGRKIA
jgi:RNA 3'-terminal phosphate cyclase-like protein